MWRERLKGLVVIFLLSFLVLAVVRYLARHRPQDQGLKLSLSPQQFEEKVLGVIHYFSGRDTAQLQEDLRQPVKEVEKKALDLIEEIKNLPQEEAAAVKKQVLGPVCQDVLSLEGSASTQEAER